MSTAEQRHRRFYDEELPSRASKPVSERRSVQLQQFVERCDAESLTKVIEVGCGAARDGVVLRDAGLTYVGVDLSPVGVEICRAAGLDAREASAVALPFDDDAFDCGWSMSTFMHLAGDDMGAAVAEIARVVRPGGICEIGVWGSTSPGDRIDEHGRLFHHLTDADFCAMLSGVGVLEEFDTWDWIEDGGHYQWGRVRIR